ncbi:hypothetical protein TNCV_1181781 [Trichonephila clavipes]|nr:hypothetical protein TNCV_1181781 [Trichonephila clavipes]
MGANRGNKRKERWSFQLVTLPVKSRRRLSVVQHDASQYGKRLFAIVLTSTNGDFTLAEKVDMHYMYDRANGNGRVVLRMYHAQFPDRRMPDHRSFQRLHHQLREQVGSTSPDMMLVDEEL